jgi:putative peptidoglycan lipid II flippase
VTTAGALARAGAIVSAAFFAARLLGWLRTTVITALFGASPELDAFFAAFRIPDLMFQLVAAGALASALIPVVASLLSTGETERAWRVVSTVANLMVVALLVLTVAFALLAPVIVPLITPGFDAVGTERTIRLTRIMLLGPMFLALGAVATCVLNASDRFGAAALAPVVYNVAIIVAAVVLGPFIGVTALAVGVVAGSIGHLAIQLPPIGRLTTYRWMPLIDRADPQVRRVAVLLAPRAFGLAAAQVTFLVNTTLASTLGPGAITAYTVAFTTLQLPLGIVAVPLGVVLLPTLSRAVASGALHELASMVDRSVRVLGYVMMLVTVLMFVLRREIVELLFAYGRFDERAIVQTTEALAIFLIGLTAHALITVLARAFYAAQDTRTPVAAALVSVAVNVAISVATVGSLGLAGLALGIAVGAWVETLLLLWRLGARVPGASLAREVWALAVFGAGALLAGVVGWVVLGGLRGLVGSDPGKVVMAVEVALVSAAGGLVYLGWSWLVRLPEPARLVRVARQAFGR